MDVSASNSNTKASTQVNVMKKAMDIQEKMVTKAIESATQQSQEVTAQKTGVGKNINLTA